MTFKESITTCFSKYATFSGRAARSEYWFWALFTWLVAVAFTVVDMMLFGTMEFQPLSSLFSLAVLVPSIAVGVRRLHDIDRSGWWLLIMLIPLIGLIVLLIWFVKKGTDGPNRFGDDPLSSAASLAAAF